jgi:hypothetical protein
MATYLEVRRTTGTKFYHLELQEDIELAAYWKSIDCGCRAYQQQRMITWPKVQAMLPRLTESRTPVPVGSIIYKVIA